MRRVHGEATECVVFMGRQRNVSCSWGGNGMHRVHREDLDGTGDGNEAWRIAERRKRPCVRPAMVETGSCSSGGVWRIAKWRKRTSYGRNGGPVDREGCGVPQNGGNGLVLERYGRNGGPVHREGRCVPQNRRNGLVFERYGQNGGHVHREGCGIPKNGTPRDIVHLHRRPPPASTGYCSSTVDLLQPPPATVHPQAAVHPASTVRYSTGYCSTSPLHGLLFNHPSTGYCSSCPPPSTIHPALHGVILFIQPSTGSCSSSPKPARSIGVLFIQRQHHGVLFIHPHRELFIQTTQQRSLFIQRQHRSASVSSSSEGITRSGSLNSH